MQPHEKRHGHGLHRAEAQDPGQALHPNDPHEEPGDLDPVVDPGVTTAEDGLQQPEGLGHRAPVADGLAARRPEVVVGEQPGEIPPALHPRVVPNKEDRVPQETELQRGVEGDNGEEGREQPHEARHCVANSRGGGPAPHWIRSYRT